MKWLFLSLYRHVRCSMQLPSKLFSFEESTLSKFAPLLKALQTRQYSILELYSISEELFSGVNDFINTLDCLYALKKIDFKEDEEVLIYAEGNTMR